MSRAAAAASSGYGVLLAATLGLFLFGIPIQLTDSFGNMLQLDRSWSDLLTAQLHQAAYLRPLLWAELKVVYDLAGGNDFAWFRGVHAAQVLALILLYLQLVRPASWRDAAVVPLGLAALVGGHTFQGTVTEAFPINTFLTVLLCCFAAAVLALAAHRWWVDVLAALLFVAAALTVESGLLVWVVFAAAAIAGARGVSRAGLGVLTALLAGYFVLRYAVLDVGSPALLERSSGFGFGILEPDALVARFADRPLVFYAYNVVASLLSVLFAEPRSGVFRLTGSVVAGAPSLPNIVTLVAVSLGTAVIAAFVWQRRREWLARRFDRGDRIVFVFVAVLAANSVISYPYTKDVIMSPAGAFYAAALYVAARRVLVDAGLRGPALAAAAGLGLVLAAAWTVREVGTHLNLRAQAYKLRDEWAYVDDWMAREGTVLSPAATRLMRRLQDQAIVGPAPPPRLPIADLPIFDID